jgi:hypothetical protein
MYEHVLTATVRCDETVTAYLVEPQQLADRHHNHHHSS